jgi:hypothetical protein
MRSILLLMITAILASGCGLDQKEYEPLYRAGKEISGATQVGVALLRYRELLQGLATEIKIAEDKAKSTNEQSFVAAYKEALIAFQDAETMWRTKIELAAAWRGKPVRIVLQGASEDFYGPLIDKYQLRLSVGADKTIAVDEVQQAMWAEASKHLLAGEAIYNK